MHRSTGREDYYAILQVERTATDEQIKQAYQKLVQQYSSDQNPDSNAQEKLETIERAYKVLGDPRQRSTYDFLGTQAPDMIDHYEESSETLSPMSTCSKILIGLICCLTGCGFCCLCFGCCCCCDFCCNRCCGLCKKRNVAVAPIDKKSVATIS